MQEELVAEIFLRVNSGGTQLTQADFILTMLSVYREEDRRRLESFAQAAAVVPGEGHGPSPYNHLVKPAADQLLRVAVLVAFQRGRLQSVLALLKGGSLDGSDQVAETESNKQFDALSAAIDEVLDLTAWHEYLKALVAAGFRRQNEISSANNVMLVYALYLIGRTKYGLSHSDLRTPIARYFFMSSLTGRYTGSFETRITQDVQAFAQATTGKEYLDKLQQVLDTTLTDDYWAITLPSELATSASRSPALYAYAASLCLLNARVPPFVTAGTTGEHKAAIPIAQLFDPVVQAKKAPVERHHLFPRAYLESQGITGVNQINQIANMCYVEWPENVEISATPPATYWPKYASQFTETDLFHHALPDGWSLMGYEPFLEARRRKMAQIIASGFKSIGTTPVEPTSITTADHYLHPSQPFSNDLAIRRIIRKLEGTVFWYEQHMPGKALEILLDELQLDHVDEVRLLSGPANVTSKVKRSFERFVTELEARSVACEWRVLTADRARLLHARVIADDDETYEVPPLNSVLAGAVDSIHASEIPLESFKNAYEEDGVPLADYMPTS